jgi:hypothetical protein
MEKGKADLSVQLGTEVPHFAYPFGQAMDMPRAGSEMLRQAGYKAACSTRFGCDNSISDLYALRRIPVEPEHQLEDVVAMCTRTLHPRRVRQIGKELLWKLHLRGKPAGKKPD